MKKTLRRRLLALFMAVTLILGMSPQLAEQVWADESGVKFTVKLGHTVLLNAGVITGNTVSGITVSDDGSIALEGLEAADKTLTIEGDGHVFANVSGSNTLKNIVLGKGTKFEADGQKHGDEECSINLAAGIGGIDAENKAGLIRLLGDVILRVGGSGNAYADEAISYVDEVKFENYNFHERDNTNVEIYAHKIFNTVENVTVSSAKVSFCGEDSNDDLISSTAMNLYVTAEGVAEFHGLNIANDTTTNFISRYYSSYPESPVVNNAELQTDMSAYQTDYTLTSKAKSSTGKGKQYKYSYSSEDQGQEPDKVDAILTSLDPILYSVSYQIDEGIDFPNPTKGSVKMNGFEKGYYIEDGTNGKFEAWIAAGETVNVTILPDKGYQYQKDTLNINGQIIENTEPSTERGTYTFTMPANAGHICAGFAKTEDIVDVATTTVKAASIDNTEDAIENGNAKLEIKSENVSDTEKANLQAKAGDLILADVLDIDLSEAVVKNYDPSVKENDSWDTELHELENPVDISVTLSDSLKGATEYKVLRNHNGTIENINANYDAATNTLSFTSDKFSTYAIFKSEQEACSHPANQREIRNVKAATFTKTGYTGDRYCKLCGEKIQAGKRIAKIASVKLSTEKYVYNGKVKNPTVVVKDASGKVIAEKNYTITKAKGRKTVGSYTYKLTFKGNYSGTKKLSFSIVPKGTAITKITATKAGFKVSWKKQATQTSGYQIQYAANKKFSSAKTVTVSKNTTLKKTISKLKKGRKYYVRIRTYKTVGTKKYYSKWSSVKNVTTKEK